MGQLVWCAEYSVGIDELDEQHKILILLIDRLFQAAVKRQDRELTTEALDTLLDYTRTHFALEERLLSESGYPAFTAHQEEHEQFIGKVADLLTKFQVENRSVTLELMTFLNNWLREHILKADKAYAPHLARSDIAKAWATSAHADSQQVLQARPWWRFWSDSKPHST